MGESRLVAVDPTMIGPETERQVRPFLDGVLDCSRGVNDFKTTLDLVRAGSSQLWVCVVRRDDEAPMRWVPVGAFVTELIDYPKGRVLRMWAGGGDWSEMLTHMSEIEAFAREERCELLQADCPPTLRRVLAEIGPVARAILERSL